MIIENYLATRVIDSNPLTRSYITRARGLSLPFVHRSCSFPAPRHRFKPLPHRLWAPSKPPVSFAPTEDGARARRLSGVRSTNKSNTPRFVPRESNSFTIHEFIMGTTEDTAGPPLLIYRYAYPASRTGPIFPSNVTQRSWWGLRSRTGEIRYVRQRAKINLRRGEMFVQLFFSREVRVTSRIFITHVIIFT